MFEGIVDHRPEFDELVGTTVRYISESGKTYNALVTAIPKNPGHGPGRLPTISLEFRDERNKLVRKQRVTPDSGEWPGNRQVYQKLTT
jgi:hypothetical protein